MTTPDNTAQASFWNGEVGRRWVTHEEELDLLMADVLRHLAAAARPGQRVLEIGCGSGGLSLLLAEAVGAQGKILALDISALLLDRARLRANGMGVVEFLLADAQTASLPEAHFDLVLSHFGAMFFSDPVAAFINIRRAMKPGAELVLAAWGPVNDNAFFLVPQQQAISRLGTPTSTGALADAPGPFAFGDSTKVVRILADAGFSKANGGPVDFKLHHPGGSGQVAELLTRLGPAAGLLREMSGTEADRRAIAEDIRKHLLRYETEGGISIPARINIFTATA